MQSDSIVYTKCKMCGGSGREMGGGMIPRDCSHCDGSGAIEHRDQKINSISQKEIKKEKKDRRK